VANPLLVFWLRLRGQEQNAPRRTRWRTPVASDLQPSATIFLILRRMRAPLITLISIFALSVLGLTLIPGRDDAGEPWRMGFFDAFYFMSYTATTIGFGELPYPFTDAQRLWVMVTIYITVIGWAYAISALLTLLQDQAFHQALALQHFTRKVARLREPFLLIAGYGQTGELLGRSFDALAGASPSSTAPMPASRPSIWTPTTPTCRGWSGTHAIPITWELPAWTTRIAKACSRSPTTMRSTSRLPWPRPCFARNSPSSRAPSHRRSPTGCTRSVPPR